MRNIYDFSSEELTEKTSETKKNHLHATNQESINNSTTEQAKNIYDKYKDFSQEELMHEFLTSSKEKLKNGSLTSEKIEQTANMLSPYLNNQQKEFLKGLLDKLND